MVELSLLLLSLFRAGGGLLLEFLTGELFLTPIFRKFGGLSGCRF